MAPGREEGPCDLPRSLPHPRKLQERLQDFKQENSTLIFFYKDSGYKRRTGRAWKWSGPFHWTLLSLSDVIVFAEARIEHVPWGLPSL